MKQVREGKVQREIELALGAEPDLLLMRNANGVARYVGRRWARAVREDGPPERSPEDLVGIPRRPSGRWFGL